MLHIVFIVLHIAAGIVAIMCGVAALTAHKRGSSHTIASEVYNWLFMVFALSTCMWAIIDSVWLRWLPHAASLLP